MDRLARKFDDPLHFLHSLAARGFAVVFIEQHLMFAGEDVPVAILMFSVMAAETAFERTLIRERLREGSPWQSLEMYADYATDLRILKSSRTYADYWQLARSGPLAK